MPLHPLPTLSSHQAARRASPPRTGSPQVTTVPSHFSAQKAEKVAWDPPVPSGSVTGGHRWDRGALRSCLKRIGASNWKGYTKVARWCTREDGF